MAVPFAERICCSVADAAEALGIGRTKTWELIKTERLQTRRIDGRTLVVVRSILNLLNLEQPQKEAA